MSATDAPRPNQARLGAEEFTAHTNDASPGPKPERSKSRPNRFHTFRGRSYFGQLWTGPSMQPSRRNSQPLGGAAERCTRAQAPIHDSYSGRAARTVSYRPPQPAATRHTRPAHQPVATVNRYNICLCHSRRHHLFTPSNPATSAKPAAQRSPQRPPPRSAPARAPWRFSVQKRSCRRRSCT
jgi:hypothetical protein